MALRRGAVLVVCAALLASSLTLAPSASAAACTPTTATVDGQQVLTFTSTSACTWEVPEGVIGLRILLVGGGGGGGTNNGAGGGGGGRTELSNLSVTAGNVLTVTAGAGGTGGVYVDGISDTQGTAGSASTVQLASTTYSATGGGAGASSGFNLAGGAPGSGGSGSGGRSSVGDGYAGTAGSNGFTSDITGATVTYGGGGGGGIYVDTTRRVALGPASGGAGGGGAGASDDGTSITIATAGSAGLGGGGGGGSAGAGLQTNGANGGSGVVIIRYATVPSAPGVSTGSAIQIIVDNDFAILAGDATNVTRLIYNNDYSWPDQIARAASVPVNLQAGETYIYIIPMGGGGNEDVGGDLGGLNITGISGAQRAVDTGPPTNYGYRLIQSYLTGYNLSAVANGTYSVAMEDVRTGLTGATWGSAVATNSVSGSGIPPEFRTGGPVQGSRRHWLFPDSTAVAFRYPASSVSLPPVPGDSQVKVYWSTPQSNGGDAITDYVVQYRTTAGPGAWQTFSDGISTASEATVTGLTNGTSYDFQVAAVNSQGRGSFSSAIAATPGTVPSVPMNVTGAPSGTQAVLNWTVPTSTGGFAISDYVVQYRTSAGPGSWTTFSDGTSTNTTATVTGLTNGTSYDFRVAATNSRGTGEYSSPITPVWGATVPGAPLSPTSTPGNTQVLVSWSVPGSNGGTPITDYIIEYRTGSGSWTTFADGTSTARTATVTGLTNGTTYDFRVTAVNANGPGSPSTTTTATPVAPSSGGGGGFEPAPDPTPTSAPTPTPSPTIDPIQALAPENANPRVPLTRPLPLGSSVASVGGEAAPATARAVTTGSSRTANTVEVASSDFSLRLSSVTPEGRLAPLDEGQFLLIESRPLRAVRSNTFDSTKDLPKVRVSGFGFKPGSDVRVFLLANWYLGAVPVANDGSFGDALPVPSGIPQGEYTLQANGFTATNLVRSVSTGVKVTQVGEADRVTSKKATVFFPGLSAELSRDTKRELRQLSRKFGAQTVRVSIDGYVQQSDVTSNDVPLSVARARAVSSFLREQGVTGQIRPRGKGIAPEGDARGRKVVITWQYRSRD